MILLLLLSMGQDIPQYDLAYQLISDILSQQEILLSALLHNSLGF